MEKHKATFVLVGITAAGLVVGSLLGLFGKTRRVGEDAVAEPPKERGSVSQAPFQVKLFVFDIWHRAQPLLDFVRRSF